MMTEHAPEYDADAYQAERARKAKIAGYNRKSYHKRKKERMIDELVAEELELEAMCDEPFTE